MKERGRSNFEQLIEWFEAHSSIEGAKLLFTQLSTADEAAQADTAWLHKFYKASRTISLAEPPAELSERLEHCFATYARNRRSPSPYKSLKASLSFDNHLAPAWGTRPAVTSETRRQLVFTTELATIGLTVQQRTHGGRFNLLGRILPTAGTTSLIQVLLLKDQQEFDRTLTNDLGKFTLIALPPGFYDLIFSSDQYEITISALYLSP
jgi:hypothetical protein